MKMLLQPAKIRKNTTIQNINGINSLDLSLVPQFEIDELFRRSLYHITSVLSRMDLYYYGKVCNEDVFCIYDKKNFNEEIIKMTIDKIVDKNVEDVINYEDALIDVALNKINYSANKNYEFYCEETIFWDVANNMIIVIGKNNLIKMAYILETESYRFLQSFITDGKLINVINKDNIHSITRKALKSQI